MIFLELFGTLATFMYVIKGFAVKLRRYARRVSIRLLRARAIVVHFQAGKNIYPPWLEAKDTILSIQEVKDVGNKPVKRSS